MFVGNEVELVGALFMAAGVIRSNLGMALLLLYATSRYFMATVIACGRIALPKP